MTRYKAVWIQDSVALKTGWWIQDTVRSTPGARVFVGGRHVTHGQAVSAIVQLEIKDHVQCT